MSELNKHVLEMSEKPMSMKSSFQSLKSLNSAAKRHATGTKKSNNSSKKKDLNAIMADAMSANDTGPIGTVHDSHESLKTVSE